MANLTPSYGQLQAQGRFNSGVPSAPGQPSGVTPNIVGHRGTTSSGAFTEPTCVHHYVAKEWGDGSHEDYDDHQLVFALRVTPDIAEYRQQAILNLPQINARLRDLWVKARHIFRAEELPHGVDPDVVGNLRMLPDNYWGYEDNVRLLVDAISSQRGGHSVRFVSKDTIRMALNILGVLQNMMGGGDPLLHSEGKRRLDIDVLNVVVKDIAEVKNYWGTGVKIGSRLWVILKRVKNKETGMWENFAFVPAYTYERDYPSMASRLYRDHTGTKQYGDVFYIGQVSDNEWPSNTPNSTSKKAAGLIGTAKENRDAQILAKPIKISCAGLPGRQRRYLF